MNRKLTPKFIYLILLFLVSFPVLLLAQDLNLLHDRTFDLSSGMNLEVIGASGDINVSGWEEEKVHVKIFGNDNAEEKIEFKFEETSSGLVVTAEKEGDSWSSWSNIRLKSWKSCRELPTI